MKSILLIPLLFPFFAFSQLQLAPVFSDHMVLQRERPLPVWGKAVPGSTVEVAFGRQKLTATVKSDSSWMVYLDKKKANKIPQTLAVSSGSERIELRDILIGDIWICSGQSNMEWPMRKEMHWRQEKHNAQQPLIRLNNPPPAGRNVYGIPYNDSLNRRLTPDGFYQWESWLPCDSQTVKEMSAVAYYFAKDIIETEDLPIGLINLSIGGAPAETFIRREAIQHHPRFAKKLAGNWLQNHHLPVWVRQRGRENVGMTVYDDKDSSGPAHAYKPGFAFESGIKPLLPLPVKGVLWYQGESNAQEKDRVEEYKDLLHLLIADYRAQWGEPGLPFYWVQLSSIDTLTYASQHWPQFRDEQRKLLDAVENSGMAVCSDIGLKDNVHPTNKKLVGERLARWALADVYKRAIVPSGPLPLKARHANGKLVVHFRYSDGLQTADGKPLRGFSLDGKTDMQAIIRDDVVVIEAPNRPDRVYYGWKPFTDANLVNAEKLPASTFSIRVE